MYPCWCSSTAITVLSRVGRRPRMEHFTFGRNNGLRVSEFALGAGMFGTRWGLGAEAGQAVAMLDRFAEAGGTVIDTAASYQFGESEEILGPLLTGRREAFTLATK